MERQVTAAEIKAQSVFHFPADPTGTTVIYGQDGGAVTVADMKFAGKIAVKRQFDSGIELISFGPESGILRYSRIVYHIYCSLLPVCSLLIRGAVFFANVQGMTNVKTAAVRNVRQLFYDSAQGFVHGRASLYFYCFSSSSGQVILPSFSII